MLIEYTNLGRTDIEVSRICFGGWQASGWSSSDDQTFIDTLSYAMDNGINFVDTAEGYGNGHSEKLIAQAIRGRRDKVVVASKFSHTNSSAPKISQALERSLRNLQTDYIDLYQQHWPPKSPALDDTINELEKLKQSGKIRAIGVSNWTEPEWQEISNPARIESLQPCYSLLWRGIESKVLPLCLEHNIAILPYSPLCQGLLAGRFKSLDDVPSDHRKNNILLSAKYFPLVSKVVQELENCAKRCDKSTAQTALRWLLDRPGVTAAITGCSSRKQVDENLGVFGWSLPSAEIESLDKAGAELATSFGPHQSLWNWHPRS